MYSKKYNKKVRVRSRKLNVSQNRQYYTKRANKQKKTKKIQKVNLSEMIGGGDTYNKNKDLITEQLTRKTIFEGEDISKPIKIVFDEYENSTYQMYVFKNNKIQFSGTKLKFKLDNSLLKYYPKNKTTPIKELPIIDSLAPSPATDTKSNIKILYKFIKSLPENKSNILEDISEENLVVKFIKVNGTTIDKPLILNNQFNSATPEVNPDSAKYFSKKFISNNRRSGMIAENLSLMNIINTKVSADNPAGTPAATKKYAILFLRETSSAEATAQTEPTPYVGILFDITDSKIIEKNVNVTVDAAGKVTVLTPTSPPSSELTNLDAIITLFNELEPKLDKVTNINTVVRFATVDLFNPTLYDAKFEFDKEFYAKGSQAKSFLEGGKDNLAKMKPEITTSGQESVVVVKYENEKSFKVITKNNKLELGNYVVLDFNYDGNKFLYLCGNLPLNLNVLKEFFQYYHNTNKIKFKFLNKKTIVPSIGSDPDLLKTSISSVYVSDAEVAEPTKAPAPAKSSTNEIKIYAFDFDMTLTMQKLHNMDAIVEERNQNKLINCLYSNTSKTDPKTQIKVTDVSDTVDTTTKGNYDDVLNMLKALKQQPDCKIYVVSRNFRTKLITVFETLGFTMIDGIFGCTDGEQPGTGNENTYIKKLYNTFSMGSDEAEDQQTQQEELTQNTLSIDQDSYKKYWSKLKVLALDRIIEQVKKTDTTITKKNLLFLDDNAVNTTEAMKAGFTTIKVLKAGDRPFTRSQGLLQKYSNGSFETTDPSKKSTDYKQILHKHDLDYVNLAIDYFINPEDTATPAADATAAPAGDAAAAKIKEINYEDFKTKLESQIKHIRINQTEGSKDYIHIPFTDISNEDNETPQKLTQLFTIPNTIAVIKFEGQNKQNLYFKSIGQDERPYKYLQLSVKGKGKNVKTHVNYEKKSGNGMYELDQTKIKSILATYNDVADNFYEKNLIVDYTGKNISNKITVPYEDHKSVLQITLNGAKKNIQVDYYNRFDDFKVVKDFNGIASLEEAINFDHAKILHIEDQDKLKIYGKNTKAQPNYFYCIEVGIDKNQLSFESYNKEDFTNRTPTKNLVASTELINILKEATNTSLSEIKQIIEAPAPASGTAPATTKELIDIKDIQRFINDQNMFITFSHGGNTLHVKYESHNKQLKPEDRVVSQTQAYVKLYTSITGGDKELYFADKTDNSKIYKIKIKCTKKKNEKNYKEHIECYNDTGDIVDYEVEDSGNLKVILQAYYDLQDDIEINTLENDEKLETVHLDKCSSKHLTTTGADASAPPPPAVGAAAPDAGATTVALAPPAAVVDAPAGV